MTRGRGARIGVTVLLLLYAGLYLWQPGGRRLLEIISDALYSGVALLATVLLLRASNKFARGTAQHRVWLLLAVGMAFWTAAEFIWAYYQIVLLQEIPDPSPADILWAIGYIPIVMSMVFYYQPLRAAASRRRKWGALAFYAIVLIVTFQVVLRPMLANPGETASLGTYLNVFYPLADLCLAFIAGLSLLVLWGGLVGQPWRSIVISMLLFAIADLLYSYGVWNNTYDVGRNLLSGIVDVTYLLAYLESALGAYGQVTLRVPQIEE